MKTKKVGDIVSLEGLNNIHGVPVKVPSEERLIHLQFRRFAGCPICNLHLQSFFKRSSEIEKAGIHEVIVFHASKGEMLKNVVDVPFDLIADPKRNLYRSFGVESSWKALFSLSALRQAMRGIRLFGATLAPSMEAELGLPAEFLINQNGQLVALNYGTHANDQWSVDDLLAISNRK
jgi:peroxiredoxin